MNHLTQPLLIGLAVLTLLSTACAPGAQQSAANRGVDQAAQSDSAAPAVGAPPAPAASAPRTAAQSKAAEAAKSAAPADATQRLIVKTATMSLLVADVPDAANRAQRLAETLGGFVVTASQREEGGRPAASVQMRVPAERFDEAMAQLRQLAERVTSEQVNARDVTEEFVDNDARLRTLRAQEQRYLELLAQARTVEDILKIEQQLGSVRQQIEQLQGRQNLLQRTAELSTITVELRLPAAAQAPPPSDWALQPIFRNALFALLATLQFLLGVLTYAVVFSPLWIPLLLLIRWIRRRRRARRAGPPPPAPAAAAPGG